MVFVPNYSDEEQAFFAAIAAEPLENASRLVYADWLEERGDPLAEFIRVQCAISDVWEAVGEELINDAAWYERSRQEHLLSAEFFPLWQERLKNLPVEFVGFDRGLPDKFYISAADFVECADELFTLCPWAAQLHVDGDLNDFPSSPHWARIRGLELGTEENAGDNGWLARLLRSLNFERIDSIEAWDQPLSQKDLEALATSPYTQQIQHLSLWRSNLTAKKLQPLVAQDWPRLHTLRLGWHETFKDRGMQALAQWPSLAKVLRLDLVGLKLGPSGAQDLAASPYIKRVVKLSLEENKIGDDGVEAILTSTQLANLRRLNLSSNELTHRGLQCLVDSPGPARFQQLELRDNQLGDEGASCLAESPQLVDCQFLDLHTNQLTAAAVETLVESPLLANLHTLSLADNGLGDQGAAALGRMMHPIKDLFLDECGIGPNGIAALLESPFAEQFLRLSFSDNPVGDAGAQHLGGCAKLRRLGELSMWDAKIGDAGACALAASEYFDSLQELSMVFNPIKRTGCRAFTTAPHLPKLNTLWLPDAESQEELDERTRLLQERFGQHIDLGEVDVAEDEDDEEDSIDEIDEDDEAYYDDDSDVDEYDNVD